MHRYEIIIYWSNEGQVFVAEVPELPGCMAYTRHSGSGARTRQRGHSIVDRHRAGIRGSHSGTEGRTSHAGLDMQVTAGWRIPIEKTPGGVRAWRDASVALVATFWYPRFRS